MVRRGVTMRRFISAGSFLARSKIGGKKGMNEGERPFLPLFHSSFILQDKGEKLLGNSLEFHATLVKEYCL